MARHHPVITFFALAYGLSWAYWIPLALAGVRVAPGSRSTHFPGLLGPVADIPALTTKTTAIAP